MSGYFLYQSTGMENLVPELSYVLSGRKMFDETIIITQNSRMAEWLKLRLAMEAGVCGNLDFENQESGRKKLSCLLDPCTGEQLLSREDLILPVYLELQNPDCLRGVMEWDEDPRTAMIQKLRFAGKIASVFSSYDRTRQEMIYKWMNGGTCFHGDRALSQHEKWQKDLWNSIYSSPGIAARGQEVLSLRAGELKIRNSDVMLCIFGSVFLHENNHDFFHEISGQIEVHHFVSMPSLEFLGDVIPVRYKTCQETAVNSILENNGRLARQHQAFMDQYGDVIEKDVPPGAETEDSFLGCIQRRISRPFDPAAETPVTTDDSLKIISACGRERQVEILFNSILKLLDENPGLKCSDIAVMAPDINEFKLIIETVFSQNVMTVKGPCLPVIPRTYLDLNSENESVYIGGFKALLGMCGSRFTGREVNSLFQNVFFREKFKFSAGDAQLLSDIAESLEIKWGIDSAHRQSLGFPGEPENTWEHGILRLYTGFCMDGSSVYGDVLPFSSLPSSMLYEASGIFKILRSLMQDLSCLCLQKDTMTGWADKIRSLAVKYLLPESSAESNHVSSVSACLDWLAECEKMPLVSGQLFDFETARHLLFDKISGLKTRMGSGLHEGVCFASIRSLRSIPYDTIFLIGMDEGAFPGCETPLNTDLKQAMSRPLDASQTDVDRFSFLETLMSARKRLHIMYTGRDPLTGAELNPSAVVRELIEYCMEISGREPVESHPLLGFDASYFSAESGLFSFIHNHYSAAAGAAPSPPVKHLGENNIKPMETIDLDEMRLFLRNPVKHYMQTSLEIFLRDTAPGRDNTDENFEIEKLKQWQFLSEYVSGIAASAQPEPFIAAEEFVRNENLAGRLPKGAVSRYTAGMLAEAAAVISERTGVFAGKAGQPVVLCRDDEGHKTYRTGAGIEPRLVSVLSAGGVSIAGVIENYFTTGFVIYAGSRPGARHAVRAWLDYLVLRAHPEISGEFERMKVLVVSARKDEKPYEAEFCASPSEAEAILGAVAHMMLENRKGVVPVFPGSCLALLNAKAGKEPVKRALKGFGEDTKYCRYTEEYYRGSLPDFSDPGIFKFAETVYSPLVLKRR